MTTQVTIKVISGSHLVNVNKGADGNMITVAELEPGQEYTDYIWGQTAITLIEQDEGE